MRSDDATSGSPAPAVVRAAAVLQAIASAAGDPPRITDLARTLDLPKSSTMNILVALTETGLVRRLGGGYALGPTLVDLASAFLRHEDPVQRFRDFVPALATASQETVQLAMLNGADVLYLARHDGNQPITLTSIIGKRLPATSTALGKVMLSALTRQALEEILTEPLRQLTPRSHLTIQSLAADLASISKRGYAIDNEEAAANVVCLAVAVPGNVGHGAYAVSTTLFKDRLTPALERPLVEDLTRLASYLSTV
jgi:DNA-binding IclR family transcriptional regulator